MEVTIGTLHQHFCDTGSTTKIAIDLERRMRIKEIIIGAPASFISTNRCQLILYQFVGMVAIQ